MSIETTVLLVVAAAATAAALVLLVLLLRYSRRGAADEGAPDPRRDRSWVRRNPREALALFGDALAASHDRQALLPVILDVAVEATGARGGRVLEKRTEVARVGEDPDERPVDLPLRAGGPHGELVLVLDPPRGGFSREALELAEKLVSQAAVALESAQLHDVVRWQAATDELTGLANRRRFMESLTAEIGRVERFGGALSLLLADLDDFKRINDRFGHHVGDEALRRFAALLVGQLREVDVPGRLGGEEFAVVLPGTDPEGAGVLANRIRAAVAQDELVLQDAPSVRYTVSLGAAGHQGGTAETLLREADAALYRAKAEGKNRVVVAGAI